MTENKASANSSVSVSFGGLLLVILIVLKLNPGGHLDSPVEDWSWWLVIFAPLLISIAFIVVGVSIFGLALGVTLGIAWLLDKKDERKRKKAIQDRIHKRVGPDRFSK